MSELREIALDELPAWSPWPARLLGLTERRFEPRTPEKILREYDGDKYGTLLAALERDPALTVEQLKRLELGDPEAPVAMVIGERLYVAPLAEALRRTTEVLVDRVGRVVPGAASITDLGCGFGYQLAHLADTFPELALHGGEFAPNGVELARRLHGPAGRIAVERFDFASGVCAPLLHAPAPSVVLLSFVLHQLPSAAVAVETLAAHRDRIGCVLSYDVDGSVQDAGLLGLMRRRYKEVNDYSWDLLEVLGRRDDVVVDVVEPNIIGPNPLLPATLVVWRFT